MGPRIPAPNGVQRTQINAESGFWRARPQSGEAAAAGTRYRRTGKRQDALKHLSAATMMYREMDMTYRLEQVEAELAQTAG